MPRYFFHVHDGRDIPDEIGITLSGPGDARAQAIIAVAEALKDLGPMFWQHPDWQMHVIDDEGTTVCDLRLSNRPAPD
ncbi:DUF6894 family protein [Rubellimicrobium arenae]|uniref:DUF6894 family protein n=1 Tax=Rubellimicrobium arenae TaxID=2817372 RepID=UPI001B30CBC5|nr:hypothetical protein [Rubellimicrobium arenae]